MLSSFSYVTKTDGLGGAQNLRGVLRNRVVGDGVCWGNIELRSLLFDFSRYLDKLHPTVGIGLRIAWNENFIIVFDYGFALNKQDGRSGLFIGLGNLF